MAQISKGEIQLRILVTGSDGLVGSAIQRLTTTHDVWPANREHGDLRDMAKCLELIQTVEPDAIIHCAALVGGVSSNSLRGGEYFRDNILLNANVLEAARVSGVKNVTAFLSTCIFPEAVSYPITVDQLHRGEPHPSNSPYSYAKRMLDVQVRAYNNQWGTKFKLIVPTNVYGPRDNFSLTEGHAAPSLIHRMFLAKESREPFVMWGTGKALREFVYSSDIAKLAVDVAGLDQLDVPLIASPGEETSVRELVELIAELLDFSGEIITDESMPEGQLRKPSSRQDLENIFPDFKFTSLRIGIEETVSWFTSAYPNIRK